MMEERELFILEDATGTPQRQILQNFSRLIEATSKE
jgi:hypothetical protein